MIETDTFKLKIIELKDKLPKNYENKQSKRKSTIRYIKEMG